MEPKCDRVYSLNEGLKHFVGLAMEGEAHTRFHLGSIRCYVLASLGYLEKTSGLRLVIKERIESRSHCNHNLSQFRLYLPMESTCFISKLSMADRI